jgi:uncharacterized protein
MAAQNPGTIELINDTRLNVASLLMEDVGSTRELAVTLTSFPLDDDLVATSVLGQLRLTRIHSGVLATGQLSGDVELECARCLNLYDQPFRTRLTEEYRQTVDVRSGAGISSPRVEPEVETEKDDEPGFEINDAHEIDLTELLRQNILLSLPMRPDCGENCPGPPEIDNGPDAEIDSRFAALEQLLDDE